MATEVLLSGSLAGSITFARQLGWRQLDSSREWMRPSGDIVTWCWDADQLMGLRKAIAHVGLFANNREGIAQRRHLVNIAESRGIHVIPYDFPKDGPPEPLRYCLVCGSITPCLWPEDLQPGEPGIPCTFDLSYLDLFKLLKKTREENVQHRQHLDRTEAWIRSVEQKFEALSEEFEKLRATIKAYRSPRIPQRIHEVPGAGEAQIQQIPE